MSSSAPMQALDQNPSADSTTLWFEPRMDPYSVEEKAKTRKVIQKMTKRLEGLKSMKVSPYCRTKVRRAEIKATKTKLKTNIQPLLRPMKPTAKLGTFSAHLFEQGPIIVQQSELCKLPIEIINMVLKKLLCPDGTAVALTCKDLMAKVEGQRQVAQKMTLKRGTVSKQQRLAVLVRLRDWVPSKFKLCYSCVKYLPRARTGQWVGDKDVVERKIATRKAIETGPRCEMCRDRDRIAAIKAGADAQRLYSLAGATLR